MIFDKKKDLSSQLIEAAQNGNLKSVRKLLRTIRESNQQLAELFVYSSEAVDNSQNTDILPIAGEKLLKAAVKLEFIKVSSSIAAMQKEEGCSYFRYMTFFRG